MLFTLSSARVAPCTASEAKLHGIELLNRVGHLYHKSGVFNTTTYGIVCFELLMVVSFARYLLCALIYTVVSSNIKSYCLASSWLSAGLIRQLKRKGTQYNAYGDGAVEITLSLIFQETGVVMGQ